jgi:galactokinase
VPGTVTLLASGPQRLTVAAAWSAVAAAGPGENGFVELALMERPGERDRMSAAAAAAGFGPAWAGDGLTLAENHPVRARGYPGTRLLVRSELPLGTGAGIGAAIETAIRLCLGNPAARGPEAEHAAGCAVLGPLRVPCDLATAGLRLMLIDTRIRRAPQTALAQDSPVTEAAAAAMAGDYAKLGRMLTAAHENQPGDPEQHAAVTAALRAGALGGRALTEGPGRPVLLLVPVDQIAAVRAGVSAEFARGGARAPRFLTFTPAGAPEQPAPL